MKIAVVKSSVYQDLWVTNISNNPYELFKTSLVRCPPIGLAEAHGADFIIVKVISDKKHVINKETNPSFSVAWSIYNSNVDKSKF